MAEKLRTKTVASQPKARKKSKLSENVEDKNYQKNPEKENDHKNKVKKAKVMEENDYAGIRTVDDKHNVTEKPN